MIRNCKDVISTIRHRGDMMGRLEEFRRKTDIWCDQNVPRDIFFDLRWEEKFYELIVQECIDIAYRNNNSGEGGVIADNIKEHFGVKE